MRQNFINQQQQQGHGGGGVTRVLTSPVGYNSDVPPNTSCQPQQHQQQFRIPRSMSMTTTNTQMPGINKQNIVHHIY